METLAIICLILAAIGALNWGLVGLFKFDLVALIAGGKKFGEVRNCSFYLLYFLGQHISRFYLRISA